jgi:hypothetical protein
MAQLVTEKDSGLRQAMRTMGLMDSSYWGSWLLFDLAFSTLLTFAIIFSGAKGPVSEFGVEARSRVAGAALRMAQLRAADAVGSPPAAMPRQWCCKTARRQQSRARAGLAAANVLEAAVPSPRLGGGTRLLTSLAARAAPLPQA